MSSSSAYLLTRLRTSTSRSGQEATGCERSIRSRSGWRSSARSRVASSARSCGEPRAFEQCLLLEKLEHALHHAVEAVDAAARDPGAEPEDIAAVRDVPRDRGVRPVEKR